jgi:RNA polymerase sporulation-specific sigma factor
MFGTPSTPAHFPAASHMVEGEVCSGGRLQGAANGGWESAGLRQTGPVGFPLCGKEAETGMYDIAGLLALLRDITGLIAFVSGHSSFPLPLGSADEQECIRKAIAGDKEARDQLVEHNLRLVAHVSKKYQATGIEIDDLIGIGTIGLIKAVNTFNHKRGTQLATYAARCIENEILMAIRFMKKRKNEVLLQDPIGTDGEGNQISLMDKLGSDPDELVNEVETRIRLKKLVEYMRDTLDRRERAVLVERYGLCNRPPRTQREIARDLGISRSYVSRIEKKAIQKLGQCFLSEKAR